MIMSLRLYRECAGAVHGLLSPTIVNTTRNEGTVTRGTLKAGINRDGGRLGDKTSLPQGEWSLPKRPVASEQNPGSQQCVGGGVRDHCVPDSPAPKKRRRIEHACYCTGQPAVAMQKAERN